MQRRGFGRRRHVQLGAEDFDAALIGAIRLGPIALADMADHHQAVSVLPAGVTGQDCLAKPQSVVVLAAFDQDPCQLVGGAQIEREQPLAFLAGPVIVECIGEIVAAVERQAGAQPFDGLSMLLIQPQTLQLLQNHKLPCSYFVSKVHGCQVDLRYYCLVDKLLHKF